MAIWNYLMESMRRVPLVFILGKSVAVVLAYYLGAGVSLFIHDSSSDTGALLACISAVVVLQDEDLKKSISQGWLRVIGAFIGANMAVVYLLFFSFSVSGMAISVFVLSVICMFLRIPDNGKMAAVTLIWVLVLSIKNPNISPVMNGSLRFLESALGVSVGIAIAWLLDKMIEIKNHRKASKNNNEIIK